MILPFRFNVNALTYHAVLRTIESMYDHDCRRCILSEGPRSWGGTVCVPGEGPLNASMMLVGEAPGAEEDKTGRPFVGEAGAILDQCLEAAGLERGQLFITNVARCRPPANRSPHADEIEACKLYLAREINSIAPRVIVALGATAASALAGISTVGNNRGKLLSVRPEYRSDARVVVTYHPAAYIHQGRSKATFDAIVRDLVYAKSAAGTRSDSSNIAIATSLQPERAERALEVLATRHILGCDLEWEVLSKTGSGPWSRRKGRDPRVIAIGLGGQLDDGRYLGVSVAFDSPLAGRAIELINSIPTVYHNAGADLEWLMSLGASPSPAGCTLLLAAMLNINTSLTLEALSSMYTELPPWKDVVRNRGGTSLGVLPHAGEWQTLLEYNARDAIAPIALHKTFMDMARPEMVPLYERLVLAIKSLADAALVGVPIDVQLLHELERRARSRIEQLRRDIASLTRVPGFATRKPGSQEAVALAIERQAGIRFARTTKTSKPSMSDAELARHHDRHPAIPMLQQLVRLTKLEGTYLEPWSWLLEQQGDNRLHTRYKTWIARTGRTSAEQDRGGTLQQFPRDSRVRDLVRARDGWMIISADLKAVELRIGAWIADERNMLRFLKEGIDPHTATAAYIKCMASGGDLDEFVANMEMWLPTVTSDERQAAKAANFGFLYGMREARFITQAQRDYGVTFTPEQAHLARRGYFSLYPAFAAWHADSWRWVRLGYVDTPLGRRRMLVRTEGEDDEGLWRKALNTPVQSTASDLALIGASEAWRRFRSELAGAAYYLGFVHDAMLAEVRDDCLAAASSIIKECMEHPPIHIDPPPLEVEIKVGQTWGTCGPIQLTPAS